ncbi:MAG: DNA internalization-related competence protein ComEC/Rec2 [Anaeroplasmataceae bacterium]|nr:DNA internalization-related competence protein ComEC/Rec2 [Anaeroplasmataceae bacterium]
MRLKKKDTGIYEDTYEVIDVSEKYVILKGQTKFIIFTTTTDLIPGDIIYAKVKLTSLSKPSFYGDFDTESYYNAKGITNQGKLIQYEKQGAKFRIERIRYVILRYYKNRLKEKSYTYLKAIFFGISELNKDISKAYSSLYLSHFLAISGLHITFFNSCILWFLRKVFRIRGEKTSLLILGMYIYFIGYPMSSLRAFLFLLLQEINKKGTIQYTKLDIFSISYIGMVILFPLKAFQSGFILSYIVSFILLFMDDYSPAHTKWKKKFFSSGLCVLSILPFLIQQTNQIFLTGIVLSFILGVIFSKFILPIILVLLVFPNFVIENLFLWLDQSLLFFSQFSCPFAMPTLSLFNVVFYYFLFVLSLICLTKKRRKYVIFSIPVYLFFIATLRLTNPYYRISYIDVGQGDSILIELPFNQGNVLIDTYTKTNSYLQSIGLKSLDFVILTHFDKDHCGTLEEICQNFKVKQILYSAYEDSERLSITQVKSMGIKSGDFIQVASLRIDVLGPIEEYSNSNANSLVLKMKINDYTFLFTGDLTKEAELDLIKKYNNELKCNVLKVGHHGSKTSSSKDFLQVASPEISIISVGVNNSYYLPDEEVVQDLKKYSTIYMTKDHGNIKIIVGKEMKICPYRK